jgi:hypothetical protein
MADTVIANHSFVILLFCRRLFDFYLAEAALIHYGGDRPQMLI